MHLDCLNATPDPQMRSADLPKMLSVHHIILLYLNVVHCPLHNDLHAKDLKTSRIHIKLLPRQAQVHHTAMCVSMLLRHC